MGGAAASPFFATVCRTRHSLRAARAGLAPARQERSTLPGGEKSIALSRMAPAGKGKIIPAAPATGLAAFL